MSAKHMRPFYVFAAVAATCAVVLVSGMRGDGGPGHGEPLISAPARSNAAQDVQSAPRITVDPSDGEFPGTDEDAPGGDPLTMGSGGAGAGLGGPDATDPLSASGARNIEVRLPEGLELPGPDEDLDRDDLPEDEHGVRGAGEVRNGHHDEQDVKDDEDDEDDKDDQDGSDDGTGGSGSDDDVDPMTEADQPADPGAGGQDTPGPADPVVPEQQP